MALTVHLNLTAAGAEIQGESSIHTMDRENTIECVYFEDAVRTARERSTGMATGDRTYEPIMFRKRIDKSSPLIAKALCNNEVIEGTWKFFRPSPAGDGTTQHFFTVSVKEGRVGSVKRVSPDCLDPASSAAPPLEEVSIVFGYIEWTYEDGGVSHADHWSQRT